VDALDEEIRRDDLGASVAEIRHGGVVTDGDGQAVVGGGVAERLAEAINEAELADLGDGSEGGVQGLRGQMSGV
jgi:hypothetical protein